MKKRIRNIISLLVLLSILMSFSLVGFAAEYEDVGSHWANSEIGKWSELEIIQGSNNLFRPNDSITRGEMAVILDRIMKYENEPPPLNFYQNLKSGFLISLLELSASLIGITAPHLRRH